LHGKGAQASRPMLVTGLEQSNRLVAAKTAKKVAAQIAS
jgi:ribosomal protein L18